MQGQIKTKTQGFVYEWTIYGWDHNSKSNLLKTC